MLQSSARKITPQVRQAEFPNEFKAINDNTLLCIFCNHVVDWKKKSILNDHLKSSKHLECKLGATAGKTQETLHQTLNKCDSKFQMIYDFVDMMVKCNIPLEKKDKMNDWLMKYIPNSGCIPTGNTLRRDYLPKVLSKHKAEIQGKIQNQSLSIIIDSTPDKLSRNVINTIVHCGFSGERFLIDTRFLDAVNNLTLFHTIDSIRQDYQIHWEFIDALVCDSAKYNQKLYNVIKQGINPNISLMRCWTHLLDLVSDTWQDSNLTSKLHIVIAKFQQLMNKSSSRKARYIQFLKDEKCPNPKSMPTMVLTRWNSWYKVVEYLSEFIFYIKLFLKTEQDQQDKSELVDSLLLILNEPIQFAEFRLILQ